MVYSEVAMKAVKPTGMTNDNPGLKLMLKMGWGGGGLGAEEEGIQEPVNVEEQIVDRQGFGFRSANGISSDFLTNVRKTLEDFSRSGETEMVIESESESESEIEIQEIDIVIDNLIDVLSVGEGRKTRHQ